MHFDVEISLPAVSYSIHFYNPFSIFGIPVVGGFDHRRIYDYQSNLAVIMDLAAMSSSHNYVYQL